MLEIFKSGGPVMYPLLACSIIVMTVIIERIIFWTRMNMQRNQSLVDEVLELCRTGDWELVREKTTGSKDYIVRILVTGILHREFSMIRAMESAGAEEIKRMRRYMEVIDTMITVAPCWVFSVRYSGLLHPLMCWEQPVSNILKLLQQE